MGTAGKWLVIGVALLTSTVVWGIMLPSLPLWAPEWVKSFDTQPGTAALTGTLIQFGSAVLAPIVGMLIGKISIRMLMAIGAAVTGLGLVGIGFATGMWQVLAIYTILLPAGLILCGTMVTAVLAVRLFTENRGLALGVVSAAAPLCSIFMPKIVGVLIPAEGWRAAMIAMGILTFALIPIILLFIRESAAAAMHEDMPETLPEPSLSGGEIMASRPFWGVILTIVPLYIVFNAIYYNIGFVLADIGLGPNETGNMILVVGLCALPAVLGFGALVDRLPHWPLLAGMTVVLALCCVVAAFFNSYGILMIDLSLMCLCYGGLMPVFGAIMAKSFGSANFARANGLITPFLLVTAISISLPGYMRPYFSSYQAVFMTLLVLLPFSLIGLLLLMRSRGPVLPPVAVPATA